MQSENELTELGNVAEMIRIVRGKRVILDADLARVYGVETRVLNQAVKRNRNKFPVDFIFQLGAEEARNLMSQVVTSSSQDAGCECVGTNKSRTVMRSSHGGRRKLPFAFTEHGAIMAATVLNSPRAVQMSVYVVRAFVTMRSMLATQRDLAAKLAELEKKLTERLDLHERAIADVIQQILSLLSPPATPPAPSHKEIGFHVKEPGAPYAVRTRTKAGGKRHT